MRRAFLIGQHIAHSLSPAMHNAGFAALGLDFEYGLLDVDRAGLAGAFARVREPDCAGSNVTMPFKPDAAAVADSRGPEVVRCANANVLLNQAGRLTAENVDVAGMLACFQRRRRAIEGGLTVVLGSGGAAAGALEALRQLGAGRIALAARNAQAAQRLIAPSPAAAGEGRVRAPADSNAEAAQPLAEPSPTAVGEGRVRAPARSRQGTPIDARPLPEGEGISTHPLEAAPALVRQAALVVNATPLGMQPGDPLPVPVEALRPGLLVYDLVYTRGGPTKLVQAALAAGALVCDGLTHVYEQALPSFRLFTGCEPPAQAMMDAVIDTLNGRRPIDWGQE